MSIPWNKGKKGLQVAWNKGKPRNPIYSLKQSISMKKRYKEGLCIWNRNKKGIHLSLKSEFKKGHIPWNKGKQGIYNKDYISRLSKSHSGKIGPKASNWQGGKSFEPYSPFFNKQLKERIRVRDNFICQLCGIPELECNRRLSVHHIDYNKENYEENNLISLCAKCHMKTNSNRKYWETYFLEKGWC